MNTTYKGFEAMKQAMTVKMTLTALAFCALSVSFALAAGPAGNFYYDGGRQRALLLDDTLVAEFGQTPNAVKSAIPGAQSAKSGGGATIYRVQPGSYKAAASAAPKASISPVFHEGGSAAGRLMALPGGVLVNFKAGWTAAQVNGWAAAKGLAVDKKLAIGENWYAIKSAPGQASLDLANQIQQSGEVVSATPNWWKEVSTR
ncbi:MAG: hypothetical protein HZA03_07845 [Nitrospinae bacterium]|nr:hypothetical protein [Nitrospinota bacterium]